MMEENKPKASFPPLQIPEDLPVLYVNLVRISHSPSELVFEFAHLLPGTSPARVLSRIVMSPLGATLFVSALGENLKRYEVTFGEIKVLGHKSLADNLFRPPNQGEQTPEG